MPRSNRVFFSMLLLLVGRACFAMDTCTENGQIYMPVAEFSRGTKHVLIVGMTHAGPRGYYARTSRLVGAYVAAVQAPVTILTEFFTCQTQTLDIAEGTKLSTAQFDTLIRDHGASNDLRGLESIVKPAACRIDVDERTLRPAYLVDRNVAGCATAHQNGFECQWGDLDFRSGGNVSVKSGDLKMDAEPLATQVLDSMSYRGWDWLTPPTGTDPWQSTFDGLILDKRNDLLIEKTMNELTTTDRVILPWGSAHLDGLRSRFEALGFTRTRVDGVLYARPDDFGKWPEFDGQMTEWRDSASPMNGNCRN